MKIPEQATLVFKGKMFDVYQWEQELYDGTKATFEGLKRSDTVQVLPVMDGKVLLSYEEQPGKPKSYTFFGGRIEENEEPLEAAKRELMEETGIQAKEWELYKVYEFDGKIEWKTYFYIAKECEKVADQSLDSGEKIEVRNVSFEDFLSIVNMESFWNSFIANDIMRMQLNGDIDSFKQKLFR